MILQSLAKVCAAEEQRDKMETDCEGTFSVQLITDLKHENHVFIQR